MTSCVLWENGEMKNGEWFPHKMRNILLPKYVFVWHGDFVTKLDLASCEKFFCKAHQLGTLDLMSQWKQAHHCQACCKFCLIPDTFPFHFLFKELYRVCENRRCSHGDRLLRIQFAFIVKFCVIILTKWELKCGTLFTKINVILIYPKTRSLCCYLID